MCVRKSLNWGRDIPQNITLQLKVSYSGFSRNKFGNKKESYRKLYWKCYSLWIRNVGPRKKWREGHKFIWNMVLENNVKNKMDRWNNEWWSLSKGQRRKVTFKNLKNRRHSWIGHIIRHNEFVVNILEGAISGKKNCVKTSIYLLSYSMEQSHSWEANQ